MLTLCNKTFGMMWEGTKIILINYFRIKSSKYCGKSELKFIEKHGLGYCQTLEKYEGGIHSCECNPRLCDASNKQLNLSVSISV